MVRTTPFIHKKTLTRRAKGIAGDKLSTGGLSLVAYNDSDVASHT